jgi:hypothetical protein
MLWHGDKVNDSGTKLLRFSVLALLVHNKLNVEIRLILLESNG